MSLVAVALSVVFGLAADAGVASFQEATFRPVDRIESLPLGIRKALDQIVRGEAIANPGESFEATDVLGAKALPRRRLLLAGTSERVSFVYYEHGGRGLHEHLLIFSGDQASGFRLVTNLSMSRGVLKQPSNIAELKAFVAKGNFSAVSNGEA